MKVVLHYWRSSMIHFVCTLEASCFGSCFEDIYGGGLMIL